MRQLAARRRKRRGQPSARRADPLRHLRRLARRRLRGDLDVDLQPAPPAQRLDQPARVELRQRGAHDLRSPAPSVTLTVASATVTRRCLRGGAAFGVTVAVAVTVQVVSQPTRSGRLRVADEAGAAQDAQRHLRAQRRGQRRELGRAAGCRPGSGRRTARLPARPGRTAARGCCRCRSPSAGRGSRRSRPVGCTNSPRPDAALAEARAAARRSGRTPGRGCCRGRRPTGCRRRRARSGPATRACRACCPGRRTRRPRCPTGRDLDAVVGASRRRCAGRRASPRSRARRRRRWWRPGSCRRC